MRTWITEFEAICARTGELKTYGGPNLVHLTWQHAQDWCYENAGHLVVVGELVYEEEIPSELDGGNYFDLSTVNKC